MALGLCYVIIVGKLMYDTYTLVILMSIIVEGKAVYAYKCHNCFLSHSIHISLFPMHISCIFIANRSI